MKILVTGSRNLDGKYFMKIQDMVFKHKDDEFIVGDADGVDNIVIHACRAVGAKVTVYGAYRNMRHTGPGENVALDMDYLARDRYMVDLKPDVCVAYWDGKSRGTKYTFTKAHEAGIPVHICKNGVWEKK